MKNTKDSAFEITVDKFVKKEIRKKEKGKNGEEIETVEVVEENHPTIYYFKRPTRRDIDRMEEEYSIEMSKSIKKGILTRPMLEKHYRENGGFFTEDEEKELGKMHSDLAEKELSLQELLVKKNSSKKKKDELSADIAALKNRILNIQSPIQELFANTAEMRAQEAAIKWLVVNCLFFSMHGSSSILNLFKGADEEDRLESYYKFQEVDQEAETLSAIHQMMTAVSVWYFTRTNDIKAKVEEFSNVD